MRRQEGRQTPRHAIHVGEEPPEWWAKLRDRVPGPWISPDLPEAQVVLALGDGVLVGRFLGLAAPGGRFPG